MGTWDCIDGGESDGWTYVPFGLKDDVVKMLTALDHGWPSPCVDASSWTVLLQQSVRSRYTNATLEQVREELRSALQERTEETPIDRAG